MDLTFASSGFFSAFGAGFFARVDDLRAGFPLTSSADFLTYGFSVVAGVGYLRAGFDLDSSDDLDGICLGIDEADGDLRAGTFDLVASANSADFAFVSSGA